MTGRASKAKGYAWERDLVEYLRANGFDQARRNGNLYGHADRGDIGGVPWVIEAKNVATARLAEFLEEAERERVHADARWCGVALKARGKGAAGGYFVMRIPMAVELMAHVQELEAEVADLTDRLRQANGLSPLAA